MKIWKNVLLILHLPWAETGSAFILTLSQIDFSSLQFQFWFIPIEYKITFRLFLCFILINSEMSQNDVSSSKFDSGKLTNQRIIKTFQNENSDKNDVSSFWHLVEVESYTFPDPNT